jgi:hypothetical protein
MCKIIIASLQKGMWGKIAQQIEFWITWNFSKIFGCGLHVTDPDTCQVYLAVKYFKVNLQEKMCEKVNIYLSVYIYHVKGHLNI